MQESDTAPCFAAKRVKEVAGVATDLTRMGFVETGGRAGHRVAKSESTRELELVVIQVETALLRVGPKAEAIADATTREEPGLLSR